MISFDTVNDVWHWVHCFVLPVLKLNTALVKVANKLREEGDITMRQLESEKKKSPSKRASGKIELLKKKLAEVSLSPFCSQ